MQTRSRPAAGLALALVFTSAGCALRGGAADSLLLVSEDPDPEVLSTLYEARRVPLVVIGPHAYVPGEACLPDRLHGADAQGRRLGGDAAGRALAGDSQARRFGGDVLGRELAGDAEGRQGGGDAEQRRFGGDVLGRELAGAAEGRQGGGDAEQRRFGGDLQGRKLAGDALSRYGGGDEAPYRCELLEDESGFRVIADRPLEIRVYDGQLRPADGDVVPFTPR